MFKSNAIVTNSQGEEIYSPYGFWGRCYLIKDHPEEKRQIRSFRLLSLVCLTISIFAAIYLGNWILLVSAPPLLVITKILFVKQITRNLKKSEHGLGIPRTVMLNNKGEEIYHPYGIWGKSYILNKSDDKNRIKIFDHLLTLYILSLIICSLYFESWLLFFSLLFLGLAFKVIFVRRLTIKMDKRENRFGAKDLCRNLNQKISLGTLVFTEVFTITALIPYEIYKMLNSSENFTYYVITVFFQILLMIFCGYCIYLNIQDKRDKK
ncbi:MAG: hypothetical protein D6B27_08260 [Gammaproteobacteria bacterium]|nr:MAG: hypothetical protein D6B27_08260 [Gammaproteobacteria bacterium]